MQLICKANAKINLTLDIVGVREDGYHILDMIMQSVSLADTVKISLNDTLLINVESSCGTISGENNIAYNAVRYFLKEAKINTGVNVYIEKNIPMSAGLGGGSADAAAVLLALNRLLNSPLDKNTLKKIALNLGADVPYFLYGGTVRVGGIGEKMNVLPPMPDCFIIIAKNATKGSTKEMYQSIDSTEQKIYVDNESVIKAIKNGNLSAMCKDFKNSFSAVWDYSDLTEIMGSFGALSVSLSGSGPSVFGVFDNKAFAENCFSALKSKKIEAYLTVPTEKAIVFE